MSTMMMNTKKRIITGVSLLAVLFGLCVFGYRYSREADKAQRFEMQTFDTEGGWGYNILLDKKVIVSQPIVPVLDTVMPFPTEESAKVLGQIVLKKILNKENFSVSKQEVEYSLSY